jgi:hypothetical protein
MGLLVSGLVVATAVIYSASVRQHRGMGWADHVCSAASYFCASSGWLAIATIVLVLAYVYRRSVKA